ncbi:MAG: CRISPR-associated RAMP protein [Chloroflexi bacterium]|nr:CRISPR-associated RAMP protein [Chloroflexota bacterium]MBU1747440.1 CRISPR-associated RAMP protein [Chloroflexota bacterium]
MKPRTLERRYLFLGSLVLKTGLHVGGGWTVGSLSDTPVIRTPDGRPFIPGSSFKGSFRSTVEKLAPAVGLKSCGLMADQGCVGAQGSEQSDFNRRRREETWTDDRLLTELTQHLCDTCKLFGSPFAASRIIFADLLPPAEDTMADKMIQVRDGVAIDRDSEKAVDRLKYDYEVVAPAQTFRLEIGLEDPSSIDLALTCLGLSEFVSGLGYIGGHRSRGLGHCQVHDLAIYELDLTVDDVAERAHRLKKYLLGQTPADKMVRLPDAQAFLTTHLRTLPALQEVPHA